VKRREFLAAGSIAGAALLGADQLGASLLAVDGPANFNAKITPEDKSMAFTVPPLPYSFDALEPYIDAKTMEIHHDKHHGAYVTNLNKALDGHADLQSKSIDDLLKNLDAVPEPIRAAVRNNGGGHWNHSLFWTLMKKGGGGVCRSWGGQVWLRLGLADRERRQAGDRFHAKPGHAVFLGQQSSAGPGRMGTRLLFEISKCSARVH